MAVNVTLKNVKSAAGDTLATMSSATIAEAVLTGFSTAINNVNHLSAVLTTTDGESYSGYVSEEDLNEWTYNVVEIPRSFANLESVMVPTKLRDQLFDIVEVVEGDDYVEITALHMFYRLRSNITMWEPEEYTKYSAASACRQILDYAMTDMKFKVASDSKDLLGGYTLDFTRKNIAEAFLDPESGLCAKFGLSLIRDNDRFYCLKNVGYFRGFIVESGKNLVGVERTESIEDIITRVAPVGKDEDGEYYYYHGNDGHDYVDSTHIGEYVVPRMESYITDLEIGKDGTTENNIDQKLHDYAQERFDDDEVDIPEVTMTIQFLSLGDTEEYKQYKDLDKVYLYDIIQIIDKTRGYNYGAQVVSVEHNILTGKLESVTIGTPQKWSGSRRIGTWQVPEISGTKIRAKTIRAGTLADESVTNSSMGGGSVSSDKLDESVDGKFERIFAEQLYISNTSEDGLLHTEFSVKEGQIQGIIQKTGINSLGQNETLYSEITQTAEGVTTLVSKTGINSLGQGETLYGKVTVEAGRITQIVQNIGADGTVTTASIVAAINATTGQGEVHIDADHVYINAGTANERDVVTEIGGKLVASDITTELISTKIANARMITTQALLVNSVIEAMDSVVTPAIIANGNNITNPIMSASVSGNTLTLTKADGSTTTFSKATTLTGDWSGSYQAGKKFVVTASPQGTSCESPTVNVIAKYGNPTWASDKKSFDQSVLVSDSDGNAIYLGSINCDTTDSYNTGYNSAKMSGSWSGNTLTISKNTTGSNSLSYSVVAAASISYDSSTHKYTATANASGGGVVRDTKTSTSGTQAYDAGKTAGKSEAKDGLYIMGPNGGASTEDKRTSVSINPANSIDLWPAFYNGSQYVWGTKCTVSANGTKFNGPGGSTYTTLYYLYNGNYLSAGNHSWYYT